MIDVCSNCNCTHLSMQFIGWPEATTKILFEEIIIFFWPEPPEKNTIISFWPKPSEKYIQGNYHIILARAIRKILSRKLSYHSGRSQQKNNFALSNYLPDARQIFSTSTCLILTFLSLYILHCIVWTQVLSKAEAISEIPIFSQIFCVLGSSIALYCGINWF